MFAISLYEQYSSNTYLHQILSIVSLTLGYFLFVLIPGYNVHRYADISVQYDHLPNL